MDYLKHLSKHDDAGLILTDLMRTYGKNVWDYAYILTKHKEAADDLMQEVFLSAFQQMHNFRGESSVKTWLLRITRNKSLNHLKSAFIRRVTLVERIFPRATIRSAEQEIFAQMQVTEIWTIVLKLPIKYREIILLEAHYGCTDHEMSVLLDVPVGTIKSRLHRARAKVEQALKEAE